jgi:flagellar motility protein MotE (MotC chaperone)
MKPAEAGKVLAHLSDTQIEGLIRQVSPRQAARLLSLIPPERAGALSRRLLDHPNPGRP